MLINLVILMPIFIVTRSTYGEAEIEKPEEIFRSLSIESAVDFAEKKIEEEEEIARMENAFGYYISRRIVIKERTFTGEEKEV